MSNASPALFWCRSGFRGTSRIPSNAQFNTSFWDRGVADYESFNALRSARISPRHESQETTCNWD
jgi:hypothetical protein